MSKRRYQDSIISDLKLIKQKINSILEKYSQKDILTFEDFNPNIDKIITGEDAKKIIDSIEQVIDVTHLTADENKIYRV